VAKHGREKIIASSFKLFLKHGYHGVSLSDIIAETQLSKGAIYYHFKSKYHIYSAAVEEYFLNVLDTEYPDDKGSHVKLRIQNRYDSLLNLIDFIEHLGDEGIKYPIRTFFIFQLECEKDNSIMKNVQASMDQYRSEVKSIIQEGLDKNEIVTGLFAEIIALQIMSMAEGIAIHYSTVESGCKAFLSKKFSDVIDSYVDLLLNSKNEMASVNI